MSLYIDAASAWKRLTPVRYSFWLGRKGTAYNIELAFEQGDFPHLAGIQYAKDIDLPMSPNEYFRKECFNHSPSTEFEDSILEKGRHWESKIKWRLTAIAKLEKALDSNFQIYHFNNNKLPFFSQIDAKFVIKCPDDGLVFFLFLDERSGNYYCKSVFYNQTLNFSANQSRLTVLKKEKRVGDETQTLYINPNYKPEGLK